MRHLSWPLVVLLALSPSILVCVCASVGLRRDNRRRRAAMRRHPSTVGRRLQEARLSTEAEDYLRSVR